MRHATGFVLLASLFMGINTSAFAETAKAPDVLLKQAIENPYYRYFNSDDINKINARQQRQVLKGQMLVVDTRDQAACRQVQNKLEQTPNMNAAGGPLSDICRIDPAYPYSSVVILRESNENEFSKEIHFGMLTSDDKNLFTATRNLGVAGLGAAGILYMMPEKISKWDRSKIRGNMGDKWKDNVKKGPVWDDDNPALNYIGHPVAGASYYQVARHLELSPMQSFGYSVVMSTFFWEYGIESFAEVPSIQDLIVTPIVGSLLGEVFFRLEKSIQENNGTVLGSKSFGKFVMVLLNPAGALSDKINKIFGSKIIKDSKSRMIVKPIDNTPNANARDRREMMFGIEVEFIL